MLEIKPSIYLLVIVESDLASIHAFCFLEIGPRRVDNGDIVLLVSYDVQ